MTNIETKWTLVQHSGAGYAGDSRFARAVELRAITTRGEESRVRKAGGILLVDYQTAVKAEETVNGITGDIPFLQAEGAFSNEKIDGLRIYLPKTMIIG